MHINLTADAKKVVALVRRETAETLKALDGFVVSNKAEEAEGVDLLSSIKQAQKVLKGKKDKIIKPLNEAVVAVRDLFRPIEQDIVYAEMALKGALNTFHQSELREAEKARRALEQQAKHQHFKPETLARKVEALETPAVSTQTEEGSRVQYRKSREVVVKNETLVPDEYWVLDMVKIRRDALGGKTIPGVTVVETTVPAVL